MLKKLIFASLIFSMFFLTSCSTITPSKDYSCPNVESYVYDTNFGARTGIFHSVAPGETLWRIAKMYEVDVETLKNVNKIYDVTDIDIGKKLYIPNAARRKDIVTLYPSNKWKYIIVHHSATDLGNSMEFNKAHLKKGWQGVGYHFVIDNGTCGKDDGQIEVSPRWIDQMDGAHCKASEMNSQGIGVCLVGNFSKGNPSKAQMDSLAFLVNKLSSYYNIPKRNILGHGQVSGAQTECPGTKFPWSKFLNKIR